jgi:2',3'-cyclic-nucleotide 2'-phosphodiesterase/3'-nucleotidase
MDRLTIYFTSDTHGYLFPTNFTDGSPRPVGLLSMRFPKDGNTLVIDGGDTLQGSPLTYYCHQKGVKMPLARAMNELGYDYVTLGNHDFNYGYGTILDHLAGLNARCLCANVQDKRGALPLGGYEVRTLESGLRVGLVGIVTSWVNLWEKPENLRELTVSDPFEAASRAVEALKSQCDVLIGLYHGGLEKDIRTGKRLSATDENIGCKLCEELPFDLLLTGHQHIAMAGIDYCGTHVVQTPCNAAAYVKIVMDGEGRFSSELCAPEIPKTLAPWQEELYADLTAWLDTPIGHLSQPLRPAGKLDMALHGSAIADFFNMVQLDYSGADVSCTSLGNELRGFDSSVTVRDVVASYVYSNTLVVLGVTGRVLRQALEQCARYFAVGEDGRVAIADSFLRPKEAHYNYDYFYGIEYEFDLGRPAGSRVTRLARGGRAVGEEERLSLVMNNYRATGAGDFDCYKVCPRLREIQTEVSELILSYLNAHGFVQIPEKPPFRVLPPH